MRTMLRIVLLLLVFSVGCISEVGDRPTFGVDMGDDMDAGPTDMDRLPDADVDVDLDIDADPPLVCMEDDDCVAIVPDQEGRNAVCEEGVCQLRCEGLTECGDACVDTTSDRLHCGDCDNACNPVNVEGICSESLCTYDQCPDGFFDNDPDEYGCECERSDSDRPDGVDADCRGMDGDPEQAVFVSADGQSDGDGSMENPLSSIADGLELALNTDKTEVWVRAGEYTERVRLVNGISVYGGFDDQWRYQPGAQSVIKPLAVAVGGGAEFAAEATVVGEGLSAPIFFSNFRVEGPNLGEGLHAVTVRLVDVADLHFEYVEIVGGIGGKGQDGEGGSPVPHNPHRNATQRTGGQSSCESGGGGGGLRRSLCATHSHGDDGQSSVNSNGVDGRGGNGGQNACPVTCTASVPKRGANGTPGQAGASGVPALIFGLTDEGHYVVTGAEPAEEGGEGIGGGGGGGGASVDASCGGFTAGLGGNGGGGGAGGCPGQPGENGTNGGASLAMVAVGSTLHMHETEILIGRGGDGGGGGPGSLGGIGGTGAPGAANEPYDSSATRGGNGGHGGAGGRGGHGAGGCAGPAIGLAHRDTTIAMNPTFVRPTDQDTALHGNRGDGMLEAQCGAVVVDNIRELDPPTD